MNHRFVAAALPHLVPLLLEQMTKQEEGQESEEGVWNVSMAAATCLALCSQVAGDAVVPLVMPYVQQHIQSSSGPESWRQGSPATSSAAPRPSRHISRTSCRRCWRR